MTNTPISKIVGNVDNQTHTHHRILVVHETVPRPDRSGCDARLMQILRELVRQGHSITLIGRQASEAAHAAALEEIGIRVFANDWERLAYIGHDKPSDWTLRDILSKGDFTFALLFQWYWWGISVGEHYIDEIRRYSPRTPVAVLSDDRHGLRERRLAAITQNPVDQLRAENIERREIEVMSAVDLLLDISEIDVDWFRENSNVPCKLLPMACFPHPPQPGFTERSGVLFVGDFTNRANVDGIEWLLREVWPKCLDLEPGIRLRLIGHGLSPQQNADVGIDAIGYVEDLDPYYRRTRVCVSPIRYCTGIQTKSLAAISRGIPLVTTPTAAEGLGLGIETGAIATDDPVEFANAIVQLHSNSRDWRKLSRAGKKFAEKTFSESKLRESIRNLTESIGSIQPKSHDPRHVFSIRKVENEFSECTAENESALIRLSNRLRGYVDLAEEWLCNNDENAARAELLHLFAFTNGMAPKLGLFSRAFLQLARLHCDTTVARSQYIETAADILRVPRSSKAGTFNAENADRDCSPEISVVIPTYNRAPTLASCLAELGRQSVSADLYEVIVVDDGSSDETQEFCESLALPFPFRYHRQEHGGTGSARRTGAALAAGKYILFLNNDSISASNLIEEHLQAQRSLPHDKCWVLGWFGYSTAATRRALTYFLATQPFLFPQAKMSKGLHQGAAYFITANLSIRREALIDAGSFDPDFRVAEDTEIGMRLEDLGYEAFYWPEARALHDHLNFRADDLMRRAQQYGAPTLRLLRKHPRLLANGNTPFGMLDSGWIEKTLVFVESSKQQADDALSALRKFDTISFRPIFSKDLGGGTLASDIQELVRIAATQLHWFYLFESMLDAIAVKDISMTSFSIV